MNKIIVVDDGYDKIELIASVCNSENDCEIVTCHSALDAIQHMKSNEFDILIIDLQIPDRLGASVKENGGIKLIEAIDTRQDIFKPTYIIGATSHIDSYKSNIELFQECGWPLVLTSESLNSLESIIRSRVSYIPKKPLSADVGIITALRHVELEAVLNLQLDWKQEQSGEDGQIYYSATFSTSLGEDKTLVVTSCPRMGIASSACVTSNFIERFKPTYLFMTGIAAGIKGRVNIGDIMIADPVWDWGSGKQTIRNQEAAHLSAPHQITIEGSYRSRFQSISTDRDYLDKIRSSWPNKSQSTHILNLHIGPIATGAVVLENPDIVEDIKKQHRELIGVEMEGYGFSLASQMAPKKPKLYAIIKSACDFANLDKNNDYQNYAAYTSANFVYEFICNDLFK